MQGKVLTDSTPSEMMTFAGELMTKSKGIGRGGHRKGAGRPRFAKTGKTSYFSTRLTPKTRDLLEAEARRRGESLSVVAEDLLQLGLEEIAAIRKPRPLKAFLFLTETLSQRIPDAFGSHLDDDYSWQSNPYMFAAFRAAVLNILDVLRPPGKIVTPPPGPVLQEADINDGEAWQFKFPDSPEEYGRDCARHLLSAARSHNQSEESGLVKEEQIRRLFELPGFSRVHYGLADAWEGLNKAAQRRGKK